MVHVATLDYGTGTVFRTSHCIACYPSTYKCKLKCLIIINYCNIYIPFAVYERFQEYFLYHFIVAVVFLFCYKRRMCVNNILIQIREEEMFSFLMMVCQTESLPGVCISLVPDTVQINIAVYHFILDFGQFCNIVQCVSFPTYIMFVVTN